MANGSRSTRRTSGREWRSIDLLREALEGAGRPAGRVRPSLGIGDDAAVLQAPDGISLVWTIDGAVEGVHFRREWLSFRDIGWRATQAAASDVAAMGARPIGALCQLVLPGDVSPTALKQLGAGQAEAARDLNCPILGGNISSGPRLELATTVLGEIDRNVSPLLRAGAKPGDEVWLVGAVGLAAAGLRALEAKVPQRGISRECVRAWRRPRALVSEGRKLLGRATACIDVSDGLVGDAAHLARESEVAVVLAREAMNPLMEQLEPSSHKLGVDALSLCLWGGEDYALLATGPKKRRPRFARVIGWVEPGAGVWITAEGKKRPLSGGFQHLS